MQKNNSYKFGFKHYFNYFKENYKISLKDRLEYKINLYSALILILSNYFAIIFFGFVFIGFV